MWHQCFKHNLINLREYLFCEKKTKTTLFNNFFSCQNSTRVHKCTTTHACWWCWRRSRCSDVEHQSLLVHHLYILVQLSRAGQQMKSHPLCQIFRHVYTDCFMYSIHIPFACKQGSCVNSRAAKWLIMINHIQNKSLFTCYTCVCVRCIFIMYI